MRAIIRKNIFVAAFAAVAFSAHSALAAIHTLGFDALTPNERVPSGYGAFDEGAVHFSGFDWQHIAVAQQGDGSLNPFAEVGFEHGVISPSNVAFNESASADVSVVSLSGQFIFIGGTFTAWYNLADFGMIGGTQTLTVQGWNGGSLVFQQQGGLSQTSPLSFAGPSAGIDRLVFHTDVTFDGPRAPLQWMVDNFQYGVVPEPSSMLQVGAGLAMLLACALRRRLMQ
jgi:hypothetical protein